MRTSDIKLEISAVRAAKIVAVIAAVALAVTMSPQLTHAGYFGPRVEQYTTAEEGHSVEIEVSVYVYGGDTWEATEYTIEGGSTVCVDHDDHTSGRTVEALPATAPASAGLYDIDVDFYDTDDCSGPVVASASETDGMIVVDPNPDQADGCGLDIVLILDESGSIDSGGITGDVRDGAEALVGALVGTGSNLAVVEFNSNARRAEIRVDGVTFSTNWQTVDSQYVTDFTYYMEAYESASARSYDPGDYSSPNFYTNWEAALAAVNDAFYDSSGDPTGPTGEPPLVLFFTDGDPTAYIDSNGDVQVNQSAKTSLIEAVPESDELKSNGSHIFVVAVEQSPGAVNEINVRGISGMDEFPSPESDFTKADYNILSGTSGLIDALTDMVTALCETSLTLTKYVHTGSDLGYVAASGWTVSGEVEITETGESYDDYEWTDPVQGTAGSPDNEGTTQSGSTGAGGTFFWQWVPHTVDDPAPEWDSSIEIIETMQTGYTFDGGSCTVTTPTVPVQSGCGWFPRCRRKSKGK
ncbi:MAG: VWA domain-containing protein, partial [Anaerolineae bacterium]